MRQRFETAQYRIAFMASNSPTSSNSMDWERVASAAAALIRPANASACLAALGRLSFVVLARHGSGSPHLHSGLVSPLDRHERSMINCSSFPEKSLSDKGKATDQH